MTMRISNIFVSVIFLLMIAALFCHVGSIFFLWICLLFSSAAYIQVHFRLDFILDANAMNPDQTVPLRGVSNKIWIHIVRNIGYLRS